MSAVTLWLNQMLLGNVQRGYTKHVYVWSNAHSLVKRLLMHGAGQIPYFTDLSGHVQHQLVCRPCQSQDSHAVPHWPIYKICWRLGARWWTTKFTKASAAVRVPWQPRCHTRSNQSNAWYYLSVSYWVMLTQCMISKTIVAWSDWSSISWIKCCMKVISFCCYQCMGAQLSTLCPLLSAASTANI